MSDENILLVDEAFSPIIIEDECEKLKPIITDFIKGYSENKDKPVHEWLGQKMQEHLPERSPTEIKEITNEIIETIELDEKNRASLAEAIANGRSKESWFASETQKATSAMSSQEASQYLSSLDEALQNANESLYGTITTQAGMVSRNPRLDGFIAEQYHAQTFNMNAEASGSQYRAKVLESDGSGYTKNSVDLVIVDGEGKIVRKYQSKYYKDAKATEKAFEHGDYRGQRKLVPEGQDAEMTTKASSVIEAPDGTTSNLLAKSKAEQMRDEAQSGRWNDLNWNEYATKDIAIGIGKQAGYAALQGAAIGVGFDVAQKLWNGEKIEADEVVETAIVSGTDFGIKAAAAGALKVGVEKEIITVIPKGTPASTFANIAFVAIEDAKILGKMMSGELSAKEGIEKIEQTTVATVAGLAAMGKGAVIGAAVGVIFGPVGAAIGGFVGGTVGYMAGSKVGEIIIKGAQKLREVAVKVVKTVTTEVKDVISGVANGIKNIAGGIASLFGF
ncbi:hypothetical protein SAMN04487884_1495 [Butyrivibrio fibrisolvens]|uniref:LXG domain-containing protein n=1 Tax=Butyrivibrio fibrisolvens TaxID=831 RepID=A0A1H9X8S2_BUTFI|nr:hypothetical protein [Butyrivibrio fibrisolvens]SES42540.1 hypothetical protein SAMN04487884_1495 [Butyrivibrio fibrisolvens]